jgi:hypothetical protein
MSWLPTAAEVLVLTLKALDCELLTVRLLKLLLSFKAAILVFSSDIMNMMADKPVIFESFLLILALMAFSRGTRSASTRFWAKEAVSTPEPADKELMIFCALARLLAATEACVLVFAALLVVVPVVVEVPTEDVAMVVAQRRINLNN